jgi:hypothetical protein
MKCRFDKILADETKVAIIARIMIPISGGAISS